ncbi:hypothetical protein [Terrabacter sp. Root181]|uniref:hypothetical protein n=1 Tax=Terrabacter sp. Root181 TaxID=1736484 RepID=UPI0006F2F676|nr:hypothetical protein [Terrabacter sp. Root181]KRB47291.1 hypothetical protein ASD90_02670 [Terrabacter sp. Root181]
MTESQDTGARSRLVINLVGVVGILFGVLPIVRYLLDLSYFELTTAPYGWLELEGAMRFLPPAMVLVGCIVLAYVLEQRLSRD